MHTVYHILIFIAYVGILVNCQGGGGGSSGDGGGHGGGAYYGGRGSSCTTGVCRRNGGIIAGSIIGGVFAIIFGVIGTIYCCRWCKGRPFRNNPVFVNTKISKQLKQQAYNVNVFQSGTWSSQYFQYQRWHGPHKFSLSFDPQSMNVTGSGLDDVGEFTINGTYSNETHRMALTKQYQPDTGDRSENLGHQVTIQLTWNAENNQFEGKWYVQTNKFHGEDKFELKFDGKQQLDIYEKV